MYSYPKLFRTEHCTGEPYETPNIAPSVVKFVPQVIESRPISGLEIEKWRLHPGQLVGKCFVSKDMVRRVFKVDDFCIKQRKGPQYDIVYEDLGREQVQEMDPSTLLRLLAEVEMVLNALV